MHRKGCTCRLPVHPFRFYAARRPAPHGAGEIDPVFVGRPLRHTAHAAGHPVAFAGPDDADNLPGEFFVGRREHLADRDLPVRFDVETHMHQPGHAARGEPLVVTQPHPRPFVESLVGGAAHEQQRVGLLPLGDLLHRKAHRQPPGITYGQTVLPGRRPRFEAPQRLGHELLRTLRRGLGIAFVAPLTGIVQETPPVHPSRRVHRKGDHDLRRKLRRRDLLLYRQFLGFAHQPCHEAFGIGALKTGRLGLLRRGTAPQGQCRQ